MSCLVFACSIFFACSIKEDRTACPSECRVFFCGPSELTGKDLSFGVWGGDVVLHDSFIFGGNMQERTYFVPKNPLVFFSGNCGYDASGRYTIAKGAQCDSLYSVSRGFTPSGEQCSDTLFLRKDFASVTLSLSTVQPEDLEGLRIRVVSGTCGYSLLKAQPVEGSFEYCPRFDDACKAVFRLPRQKDASFAMEVLDGSEGKLLASVDLGKVIAESGYSWTDADLKDIEISVAINFADATVSVMPWDDAGFIDIKF